MSKNFDIYDYVHKNKFKLKVEEPTHVTKVAKGYNDIRKTALSEVKINNGKFSIKENLDQQTDRKLSLEVKKHFLEIISTYNTFQNQMKRNSDMTQVAETLGGIVEAAKELSLREADDWFVEAFGDGGQMGRPPVSLYTSKKRGGQYSYGFKNGVFKSALKINSLLSKNEPSILHEIAHFATAISVPQGFDPHGVEYRMNLIFITNKVLGRESAESLKEAYRKENLNVG